MGARYITTDLNLKARFDLKPLADRLKGRGLVCLGEPEARGGVWTFVFEMAGESGNLEREIKAPLSAVEGLEGELRLAGDRCLTREFDLGFTMSGEEFSSSILIEPEFLERIVALGGSVRITTYRDEEPVPFDPSDSATHP